jgi:CBS domain-containing protein
MTPDVVRFTEETPLREAGQLLYRNQIGGAPVVNAEGQCVGVLSAIDFVRLALKRADATRPLAPPLPITRPFQVKHRIRDSEEVTVCILPPGVGPIQVKQTGTEREPLSVCGQPHYVLTDWQIVELEKLPMNPVRQYMTADPVTVRPDTSIRVLARMMLDAHIHRVIVVDERQRPIGVVSGTDMLAALAYASSEV